MTLYIKGIGENEVGQIDFFGIGVQVNNAEKLTDEEAQMLLQSLVHEISKDRDVSNIQARFCPKQDIMDIALIQMQLNKKELSDTERRHLYLRVLEIANRN